MCTVGSHTVGHSTDFVHYGRMKIYPKLSEVTINGGLSYLF